MKKIILIFLVAICFLTACNDAGKAQVREPNEYQGGNVSKFSKSEMYIFPSIKKLADDSDLIVHAEILSDLGTFNTTEMLKESGYKDVGENTVCTFYEIKVLETIKGKVIEGETIKIQIVGGLYKDKLYIDEYCEKLTKDFEYIFFLNNSNYSELPYELTSVAQGYLPFEKGLLSLNKKICDISLFSQGQSLNSAIKDIKNKMSSEKELINKSNEKELQRAQNSLIWSEENGLTIYEDGYTGEFIKYPVKSAASETVTSFLRSILVKEKLKTVPNEKIFHIGFYAREDVINENKEEFYMKISLTDKAVLCNGEWYTYTSNSDQKITDIFKEVMIK